MYRKYRRMLPTSEKEADRYMDGRHRLCSHCYVSLSVRVGFMTGLVCMDGLLELETAGRLHPRVPPFALYLSILPTSTIRPLLHLPTAQACLAHFHLHLLHPARP